MVNKRIELINANYSLTINCIIKLRHLPEIKKRRSHAVIVGIVINAAALYQMPHC